MNLDQVVKVQFGSSTWNNDTDPPSSTSRESEFEQQIEQCYLDRTVLPNDFQWSKFNPLGHRRDDRLRVIPCSNIFGRAVAPPLL